MKKVVFNNSRFRSTCVILSFTLLFIFFWKPLFAHNLGQSYVYLKIYDDKLTGRFEITLNDLNKALQHEAPVEPITKGNLNARIGEVHDYYRKNVKFGDNSGPLQIRFSQVDTMKARVDWALLNFTLIENRPTPDVLDVEYSAMFDVDPDHVSMVLIEQYWKGNIFNNESRPSLIFNPNERHKQLNITKFSIFNGFKGIVKLGIKHIWKGIDHILFLVALILPAAMIRRGKDWQPVTEFRPAFIYVVKIVTLFTIAHSITLSLAALSVIELPSRLVESVIAVSIAIAALDILYPIFHHRISWVVFVFGLFHGFGFASVLAHLGVLGEHLALSLFGFNLGVEIGQVVVICVIFPILYFVRQYTFFPKFVMKFGAVGLILMAAVWFVERAILDSPIRRFVESSLAQILS